MSSPSSKFVVNMLLPTASLIAIFLSVCTADVPNALPNDPLLKARDAQKIPPCKACTVLVESFKKVGMRKPPEHVANVLIPGINCFLGIREDFEK